MKKLFVSVLAIAALVACNNEQTLVQKGNAPMEFGASFVENATRANVATDPSTTTSSLTGFDVWGFMDEPAGKVFEGEDVTGEKGNFTYTNTQYWIPEHDYYFAALAPMNSANWSLNTEGANTYGAGVITFENKNGAEDLLYAATMVSTDGKEVGEAMDAVKFQFHHLLSKVKFSFTNGFDNNNAYIDVKNVKMVVPSKATIDLAVENWWDNDDWKLVDAVPVTLEFGDACAKTAKGVKQESDDERLTIPATAEQSYDVTFDVALYFGDVLAFELKDYNTKVEGVALEMGKAYNFKAELNASNISEDGKELAPIVFDVEKVEDWVDAGDQTGIIAGAVENMTLFTNVEATERVIVSGVLDGAGHTVSAVQGVDYVISATARLIEAQAGATIQNIKIDGKDVTVVKPEDTYGIRGIYTTGTGDVVVKNAEIVNCTYAINANHAGKLTVINSTLQGWNSYDDSVVESLFENVKFIDGKYHNFRPYNNTVCKNCDFGAGVVIDLSCMVAGSTIKFEGCTYNGQPLTSANLTSAEGKNVEINLVVTEAPKNDGLVQNVNNVENMTIDGGNLRTEDNKALRGIYITKGGNYNVKNVIVKNVVYALNVSVGASETVTLNVEDTTLEGWTSFGDTTTASFKNVKFECGEYANFKPYTSTTLVDCSFENGFMIDFTSLNGKITFNNCTYNGVVITEANFAEVVKVIDGDFTGKIAF